MLQITAELFSGRPNPTWIITDEDAAREVIGAAGESAELTGAPGAGYDGLGWRELVVTSLDDDEDRWPEGLSRTFALGTLAARDLRGSGELAQRIVTDMTRYADIIRPEHDLTPIDGEMRDLTLSWLDRFLREPPEWVRPDILPPLNPLRTTVRDRRCEQCTYEVSQFNPVFWNRLQVQPRNNCYNYGRNWRTDTFAQPGRAHGAQTRVMSCPTVTAAALADGLRHRCDCLPDREYPRRHVALVVAPGGDYHWYREQRDGFWGHKPGPTAARNTDNKGVVITDPESCDRGWYTDFCGYFYAGRSVVIS